MEEVPIFQQQHAKHFSSTRVRFLSSPHSNFQESRQKDSRYFKYLTGFTILFAIYQYIYHNKDKHHVIYARESNQETSNDKELSEIVPGLELAELPIYTLEEVNKHNSPDVGLWIIYKAGVYDVTEFAKVHPGGDNILLGAGNSVEPFWEVCLT